MILYTAWKLTHEGTECPLCGKTIRAKMEGSQFSYTCPNCNVCPTTDDLSACNARIKEHRRNNERRKTPRETEKAA